jgi:hypothetical protein
LVLAKSFKFGVPTDWSVHPGANASSYTVIGRESRVAIPVDARDMDPALRDEQHTPISAIVTTLLGKTSKQKNIEIVHSGDGKNTIKI